MEKQTSDEKIEKIINKLDEKISKGKNYNDENFLYWNLFVEYILENKDKKEFSSILDSDLPDGIDQLYSSFLARICSIRGDQWKKVYHDLLGIIALQQGEGLDGLTIRNILKIKKNTENIDIKATIERLRQFLDGNFTTIPGEDIPEGLFHIS